MTDHRTPPAGITTDQWNAALRIIAAELDEYPAGEAKANARDIITALTTAGWRPATVSPTGPVRDDAIRTRVLYVIDHKLSRHTRWSTPSIQTITVTATDPDDQAREISDRFTLRFAPVVRNGCTIRVRVWPYAADLLTELDPAIDQCTGQWTYADPKYAK